MRGGTVKLVWPCPDTENSRQRVTYVFDTITDIVVDPLGIFRAYTDLNKLLEDPQRLPTTVRAVFDCFSFRAVKRRPVGMASSLADH